MYIDIEEDLRKKRDNKVCKSLIK